MKRASRSHTILKLMIGNNIRFMVEIFQLVHISVIAFALDLKWELAMNTSAMTTEGSLVDPKVLLIESDMPAVRGVVDGLKLAGMEVVWARDAATSLTLRARLLPDIVLVGLRLPDVSGVTLVGQLLAPRNCGVIVLAGPEDETARVACLEAGADDYLSKPPSVRDLIARIRAVHRRVNVHKASIAPAHFEPALAVGPIRINLQHRSVHTLDGQRLNLTSAEYTALETLARANGTPVSRDRLSEAALRRPWRAEDRSVDQLVFNLRHKLPTDAEGGVLIQSIRGSGYWMRAPERPTQQPAESAWSAETPSARLAPDLYLAA